MDYTAIFLMSLSILLLFYGGNASQFTIANRCPFTVWPGLLTGSGSPLPTTGFELPSQRQTVVNIPAPWSGRIWGRTGCGTTAGRFQCAIGDCGGRLQCNNAGGVPPVTLAEFTLATNGGQDFYDISNVDGFNLPLSIAPQGGAAGCRATACPANINKVCPPELAVRGAGGAVIGCKSACLAFNQPQYCCTGAFGSPATCPPSKYSMIFKQQCPQAYSYAYDDKTSTFTCSGGANYIVTFCP